MKDSHLECCWGKKLNFEPLVNWTRCGGKGAEEPLSLRPEIVACTKLIWLWWIKTTLVSASRPLAGHEHWPSLPIFKIFLEAFWHIFHWSHIIFFSGSNSQTLSMLNCNCFLSLFLEAWRQNYQIVDLTSLWRYFHGNISCKDLNKKFAFFKGLIWYLTKSLDEVLQDEDVVA